MERMPATANRIVMHSEIVPAGDHPGRYSPQIIDEPAILMLDGETGPRDIILKRRSESNNSDYQRIYENNPFYDAFRYPLLLWKGQSSYHTEMRHCNPRTGALMSKRISPKQFYSFQLMIRPNTINVILQARKLCLEFVLDAYAKIESNRLRWHRDHQDEIRRESYQGLADAARNDIRPEDVGRRVTVLPPTFPGSPRHMREYAHDALTYCRKSGRPDLFVTMTCIKN